MKYFFLILSILSYTYSFAQFKTDTLTFFFDSDSSVPLAHEFGKDTLSLDSSWVEIQISAYTDTVGTSEYNRKLAMKRAEAIQKLFPKEWSIDQTKIVGESSKFGHAAKNRRVAVTFKVPVKGVLEREVLNLNIQFVGNQDVVLSKSYSLVEELIAKIKANTYTKIELHGHVCCGPDMILSQRRALAIQNILIDNGVDPSILESYGHSNFEHLVPEINEDDQEKNRRVEVVLIRSEMKYE